MLYSKKTRIVWILMLFAWMAVIFIMSSQPATQSSKLSGGIVSKLIAAFFNKFDLLSADQQADLIHIITLIVRKLAHFSEYFVLGILTGILSLTYNNYRFKIKAVTTFLFCVLYAVSDEIHQYFVPGRACRLFDICIDALGATTALVLLFVARYYRKRKKSGEHYA